MIDRTLLPELISPTHELVIVRLAARSVADGDWGGTPHFRVPKGLTSSGYYQITMPGTGVQMLAHRVSHEAFIGPIPDGFEVDHLCRLRSCWAPLHLEAVTGSTNQQRTVPFRDLPAPKDECPHGHDLTAPGAVRVRLRADGRKYRCCVVCMNARSGTAHRDDVASPRGSKEPKACCPHGHAMTPDNVYEYTNNRGYPARSCKACARERTAARRRS